MSLWGGLGGGGGARNKKNIGVAPYPLSSPHCFCPRAPLQKRVIPLRSKNIRQNLTISHEIAFS